MTRYEEDFYAWTQEQAALLKEKRFAEVDIENLIEEVETLGRSERRELWNRLMILLLHLLKWEYQPGQRSKSWQATIREQRRQLRRLLRESPSLRPFLFAYCLDAYAEARAEAAHETELPQERFPAQCPWTVEEVLDEELPRPSSTDKPA